MEQDTLETGKNIAKEESYKLPEETLSPEEIEKREKIKVQVFSHLKNKLREAVAMKLDSLAKNEEIDIVDCLKKVWPENDGAHRGIKPIFYLPTYDFKNKLTARFVRNPEKDTISPGSYDGNGEITINVTKLVAAKTTGDFNSCLDEIYTVLIHEVEHLYAEGTDQMDSDIFSWVEYACDEGEIIANGTDIAFLYAKKFQGEDFNKEKLTTWASENKDSLTKIWNYIIAFNDPVKQEKYKESGNMKRAHDFIIKVIEDRVKYFLRHPELL
ncbi:MAG: hypothetical protein WCF94_03225 [bacterium]